MTQGISETLQRSYKKKKNKTKARENKNYVGYFQLFRYSTPLDKICILIGSICCCLNGIAFPYIMISLGDCAGAIIKYTSSIYNDTISQEEKDNIVNKMNQEVWIYAIQSVSLGVAVLLTAYLGNVIFSYSATNQIYKIRNTFLKKVLYQDISWFDLNQSGDIATILTNNISKIENSISDFLALFIYLSTTITSGIVLGLITGWKLTLVGLAALPIFAYTSGLISQLNINLTKKEMKSCGAAGAIAEEVLNSIKTVVAFDGQEKELSRYKKHLVDAENNSIKRGFFNGINKGLGYILIYGGFALIFWFGAKFIIENKYLPIKEQVYTPSNLITIIFTLLIALWNWGYLPPLIENFVSAIGAAQEVFLIIDNKPVIKRDENNGKVLNAFCSNITFDNVFFNYPSRPDVPVLESFCLRINKGETVALVGRSGCGKTTCIQLLQRFYNPLQGKILIDNIELKDLNHSWLKQNISIVNQEPALFGTTVAENIRYGKLSASQEEIEEAAKKANIHNFIINLPNGYQTLLGERGTQISGGQKQKIAIARALVKNPQILLLDEATSSLDVTSEAIVQDALYLPTEKCTTIIVAHRLSTIKKATKIVVLKEGKIIEVGSHAELMEKKEEYYNLVNSQKLSSFDFESFKDENLMDKNINNELPITNSTQDDVTNEKEIKPKNVMLKIIKMNQSEWFYVVIGCISAAISGTNIPLYGVILGNLIQVLSKENIEELTSIIDMNCLYFVTLGVVIGISTFLQTSSLCIACEKLTFSIKSKTFKAMLEQEMGWFDRKENGVGALCSQLAGDALAIQGISGYQLGMICQLLTLIIGTAAISFYVQWKLTLVLFSMTVFLLVACILEQKLSKYDAKKNQQVMDSSASLAVEAVTNIRTVASLGCEKVFLDRYAKALEPYQKVAKNRSHVRGIAIGVVRSLVCFIYPVGIWYGTKLIIEENVNYGNVFTVCEIMIFGLWNTGNMISMCPNFQKGLVAASRIINLLERVPTINNITNASKTLWKNETINYTNIIFSYPKRPSALILNNLTLEIPKSKTVALVGSSGSGKSTIAQLLQRFYDPNSGKIIIDGKDTKEMDLKLLRSQLGVVSQEPNLFDKTITENIAYGDNFRTININDVIEAAKAANIHNFIVSLPKGYETKIGTKGTQLSGGQKQRVAIARALIRNPKILLLDEATSALDYDSERIVQEALDKAKKGRTCITIAHRLTTIQDADLICILNNGYIMEIGSHEELISNKGLYYKFYKLQRESPIN